MKPTAALFAGVFLAAGLLAGCGQPGPSLSAPADSAPEAVEAVSPDQAAAALADAGYDSLEAAADDGTAFVFLGHGTAHVAKVSYSQMQTQMDALGYDNVWIGTVEGKPAETAAETVIDAVKAAGYTKVVLRPLMVVAGDHAWNDMSGEDPDSWKSLFTAAGFAVETQMTGLGSVPGVQQLYVDHTGAAMAAL